jgi:hypothetical protein
MSIKTGPNILNIPAHSRCRILAETEFVVMSTTTNEKTGEIKKDALFAISKDKEMVLRTKEDLINVFVQIDTGKHWSSEIETTNPYEKVDPVPFEVPEELRQPETLMEKMQRFMVNMVSERFGDNSREMETFEEAMDFDIDGEEDITSPYELIDMEEEYPRQESEAETQPASEETQEAVEPSSEEKASE